MERRIYDLTEQQFEKVKKCEEVGMQPIGTFGDKKVIAVFYVKEEDIEKFDKILFG